MRRESRLSVTDVCYIAIMAAVTAVLAQIAIPMPMGVPMTMQTFAVTLCGILLGSRKGAVSMVIYLLIGTAGVPVFSAFTGGVQVPCGTHRRIPGVLSCYGLPDRTGWWSGRRKEPFLSFYFWNRGSIMWQESCFLW